jgi:hypothetical protein
MTEDYWQNQELIEVQGQTEAETEAEAEALEIKAHACS